MQLSTMLLIVVSILTILTGALVLFGSKRRNRGTAIWFSLVTIGATIWSIAVGVFLQLPAEEENSAMGAVFMIFVGSLLTLVSLVGHTSWKYRRGRIVTCVMTLLSVGLIGVVAGNPSGMFSGFDLGSAGNTVYFAIGPLSVLYGTIILVCAALAFVSLFYQIRHARKKSVRRGYLVYFTGLAISIACSIVCDLMLPMLGNCAVLWLGPVSVSTTMIGYYYAILRYRTLTLSTEWMRVLTYVILMATGAVLYMVIFYLVFKAMFRGLSPSMEVVLLNFIMVLIVLLLVPAMSEVNAFVRSLLSTGRVDLEYVVKKLNRLATSKVNLSELAGFLAEHLHFENIGFLIDGKIYGSKQFHLSVDELKSVAALPAAKDGTWQELGGMRDFCENKEIYAVAELKDGRGRRFGQMIVGKPLEKSKLQRQDLVEVEMIVNLVAVVIESEKNRKVK